MACKACVTIPPVSSDYKAKGTTIKAATADLDIYLASPPEGTTTTTTTAGIIYVPDIFGVTPQAHQVCDKLAEAGFWVAFPDVFRGKPWPLEKFPPPDRQELMDWIHGYDFEKNVKPDLEQALSMLREKGASKFGIVGFCWGGKMSTLASQDAGTYAATASAHPSFLTLEDAQIVNAPILLLPSKDEADLTEFIEAVKARGVEASMTKYEDMHHGWVAARGDWEVPEQKKRATEAVQQFADFFSKHLK